LFAIASQHPLDHVSFCRYHAQGAHQLGLEHISKSVKKKKKKQKQSFQCPQKDFFIRISRRRRRRRRRSV
jgi:hypothetical protein